MTDFISKICSSDSLNWRTDVGFECLEQKHTTEFHCRFTYACVINRHFEAGFSRNLLLQVINLFLKHGSIDVLGGSNCRRIHASTFRFDDDDRNVITCETVEATSI